MVFFPLTMVFCFSFGKIWRLADSDYSKYEAPFHQSNDWLLIMKINTTNADGMFDIIVFDEEPRMLDPALI